MLKNIPLFLLLSILSCTGSETSQTEHESNITVNLPAQNVALIDAEMFRKHWSNYVSLSLSKCEKVMYGGFKRVEFTLYNDSPYTIDSIAVLVNYLEENKKYKSGFATAVDIEQGETIVLDAPFSLRGDSVNYVIDFMKASEAKLDYRGRKSTRQL